MLVKVKMLEYTEYYIDRTIFHNYPQKCSTLSKVLVEPFYREALLNTGISGFWHKDIVLWKKKSLGLNLC